MDETEEGEKVNGWMWMLLEEGEVLARTANWLQSQPRGSVDV